ncbi:TIGR03854 family LLM class F420-dependent oxidoreductase [Nocardia sp. NPDC003482]
MKVRFGVGLGMDSGPAEFARVVDLLEAAGVDSLWLSEVIYADAVDPTVGMAFALSRTERLKVGTSVAILPGRHPVLVAKQLASLAALAPKRVLPVFGLQPARPGERELFEVPKGMRGAVFDESLRLLRAALAEEKLTFTGRFFTVRDAAIGPRPARPLDIWLGGSAPAAFERIGRFGDGWLGSFLTPAEARTARAAIETAAAAAGREIEPDHYGVNLVVAEGNPPADLVAAVRARRPDVDPAELVAADWDAVRRLVDGYLDAGITKFVVRSAGTESFEAFLDRFTDVLLPLESK